MSNPFEPDLAEQSVLFEAERLAQNMRLLRESVGRNDREAARSAIIKVKYSLSEMRSLLRLIEKNVKRIEGTPPTRQ